MLGRRRIDTNPINGGVAPLRSSLADAAWAVEERLVWGSADALRGLGTIVRRPVERLVWAGEQWVVWPLQERTDHWAAPLRAAAAGCVALLAAAAVAAGVLVADDSPGERTTAVVEQPAAAPAPAPSAAEPAPAAPVLKGVAPDFTPEAGEGVPKGAAVSKADAAAATTAAPTSPSASASAQTAAVPGPAAIKVARQFAAAFVLYETGRGDDAKLRAVFAETATPELTRSLLERPPRLPAGVEVPQAKVLNIVAGPRSGETYSFSVSLLRVGVTSELRIDMERSKKTDKWQVTDVRG